MADTREKLCDLMMRDPCPSPVICNPNCKYYKSHHCHAERYADHLIANGVTVQKWIPVTERLPETFGEYIVTVKALDNTFYSDYADYDPFQQRWTTGLYLCPKEEVTHWMPLPEPPKGE